MNRFPALLALALLGSPALAAFPVEHELDDAGQAVDAIADHKLRRAPVQASGTRSAGAARPSGSMSHGAPAARSASASRPSPAATRSAPAATRSAPAATRSAPAATRSAPVRTASPSYNPAARQGVQESQRASRTPPLSNRDIMGDVPSKAPSSGSGWQQAHPPGTSVPAYGATRPPSGSDRPSSGSDRPSSGSDRPSSGSDRPSSGSDRPSSGGERPSVTPSRPGGGHASRPSAGRPSAGRPGYPSAGRPGYPSAGRPGYPSAGRPGYPSAGRPVYGPQRPMVRSRPSAHTVVVYRHVRPTTGVFVYGPRPTYHTTYVAQQQAAPGPVYVQEAHLPKRQLDRANTLALGFSAGSMVGGYTGANLTSDLGVGLTARYRPVEALGLQLDVAQHSATWAPETPRSSTVGSASVALFAFPWSRVSPYVTGGLTVDSHRVNDDVFVDGSVEQVAGTGTRIGPQGGLGLEFALGKSLALDLEARYTGFLNHQPDDLTFPGALTTKVGLLVHF